MIRFVEAVKPGTIWDDRIDSSVMNHPQIFTELHPGCFVLVDHPLPRNGKLTRNPPTFSMVSNECFPNQPHDPFRNPVRTIRHPNPGGNPKSTIVTGAFSTQDRPAKA